MKKILVFEIPNTINEENVIIAPGQEEKQSVSILGDEFCQTFLHLLRKDKFGYKASRYIPISLPWYLNQKLLNFNQCFASDVDYPFFARSVYEQRHLRHQ